MVTFTHILCPVDFSDTSARALTRAAAVASWYEAPLTVVHVPTSARRNYGAGSVGFADATASARAVV